MDADYALDAARKRFDDEGYELMLLTGGELVTGFHLAKLKTHAHLAEATLIQLGMPESKMQVVVSFAR